MKNSSDYKVGGWCKKKRRQDRNGLYTWCSRMSDRITSQASKQALYCCISVQPILELDSGF